MLVEQDEIKKTLAEVRHAIKVMHLELEAGRLI